MYSELTDVFRQPSETWRHIFANGGTAEGYYPPMAYRRHEWCYSKQNLVLCPFSGLEMLTKGFSLKLGPNEGGLWRITLIQ